MTRSTQAKVFGLRRGRLSDYTTWKPLPRSMLELLIKIADAEKRLEVRKACGEPASGNNPH